ncbi:hypothetical protein F511_12649 [Dorcoceras hygrometricum]|uniref:Retrotransposon gag domain-containing protein n=1 Tax=Dorcoceras hygrometricum TaxID=472368 RepID=A0A2Z7CD80_9LAMI|nr:hypothetical protein F511_12649 [Dorcoceras hygrometricum]
MFLPRFQQLRDVFKEELVFDFEYQIPYLANILPLSISVSRTLVLFTVSFSDDFPLILVIVFTIEVALDSSREAISSYTSLGGFGWLVVEREVAALFLCCVVQPCSLLYYAVVSYQDARASGNTALSSPCWDLLATMRRVVNYHSSWARQQQVELFDASDIRPRAGIKDMSSPGARLGDSSFNGTFLKMEEGEMARRTTPRLEVQSLQKQHTAGYQNRSGHRSCERMGVTRPLDHKWYQIQYEPEVAIDHINNSEQLAKEGAQQQRTASKDNKRAAPNRERLVTSNNSTTMTSSNKGRNSQYAMRELATLLLRKAAERWWRGASSTLLETGVGISWDSFCETFRQEYVRESYVNAREREFDHLEQGSMTVREYARKFSSLLAYVSHVSGRERAKRTRFLEGLNEELYQMVLTSKPKMYAEAVDSAIDFEEGLRSRRARRQQTVQGGRPAIQGAQSSQSSQSAHQPQQHQQQVAQQSGRQRFRPHLQQFKKKSGSSSSGSGSSSSSGSRTEFCGFAVESIFYVVCWCAGFLQPLWSVRAFC